MEEVICMTKKEKSMDMMSYCSCCMSQMGLVHVVAGVGVGFLLVNYLGLTNLMMWGWVLVGAGLVGHFVGKMK